MLDLSGEHVDYTEVESGRVKLNFFAHDGCPFVSCWVYPAYKVEVIHVFDGPEVSALGESVKEKHVIVCNTPIWRTRQKQVRRWGLHVLV